MDELFGVSMTLIMWVLLTLLGVAFASLGLVYARNRVMFRLGVRNIPRRRAQTTLIVLGLMLSTLIIAAAFSTGDTVDRTITSEVYNVLGSLDETIQVQRAGDDNLAEEVAGRGRRFSANEAEPLLAALENAPLIDALVPVLEGVGVAVHPQRRLSSPDFTIIGLDPERARDLPDVESLDGRRLNVADLGAGEIYINASAAEELFVQPGEQVEVIVFGRATTFRVAEIVKDRRLAGVAGLGMRRQGGVLPLAAAQGLFDADGQLSMIAVSNQGDARSGLRHADAVEAQIEAAIAANAGETPLEVRAAKARGVEIAETGANIFTSFFLVMGLFSISAGVLLILMIFVMLAAERKPEMGMARAIGTKRSGLVQSFLAEGMSYNIFAAMVGTGLGVAVAFAIALAAQSLLSRFDVTVAPFVSLRSLVISYCLGVVLTFLTVTFSSWRISNINIVRAVRDIPDPPATRPSWRARGFVATVRGLVFRPGDRRAWLVRPALLVAGLAIANGSSSAGPVAVTIIVAIAGGLLFVLGILLTFRMGPLLVAAGLPLIALGSGSGQQFPLYMGLSFVPLGLALLVRSFGANERWTYTVAGLLLLYLWEFDFELELVEKAFGRTTGDIEMFFLSGLMITVAATFVAVYNSDVILGVVLRASRGLGPYLPSFKMAVAYPLASRVRTGLTMAMFCLVVFALTVMSSMNYNFRIVFLSDRALGGWDVFVDENTSNRIEDLRGALEDAVPATLARLEAIGTSSLISPSRARVCQVTELNPTRCDDGDARRFDPYEVRGEDPSFLRESDIHLQSRARGYNSDEAVWAALERDPGLAVVDANALVGGFGAGFIRDVDPRAREIEPIVLTLQDRNTGRLGRVTVIGIIELGSSASFGGVHVAEPAFTEVFESADYRRFFLRTAPGVDARALAREIEAGLLTTGAQAESLRHHVDQDSATFTGFFRLMQGFMGLGLFVGVAAVGVIAFRTVVERRQQIGMLRAMGYTRRMIGLTFLIESAFIAFMGVASGIFFAVILARQLVSEQFANQGVTSFAVPWLQLAVIGGLAFGSALLMSFLPSRQAANIPIARALRYE